MSETYDREATIKVQRNALEDHLGDNPSLTAALPEAISRAYQNAGIEAKAETGLPDPTFHRTCHWTPEQIMDHGFWPQ